MTARTCQSGVTRFAVRFLVVFAALMGGFEACRGTAFERLVVEDALLEPTTWLLQHMDPAEPVRLVGRTIESPQSRLRVIRGCEGVETLLLLVAAVIAYPASWRARAKGLLAGTAVAYALSIARLIALHLTLRHSPQAWEALHGLVLPLAPVVLVSWYFLHWSARQSVLPITTTVSDAP